jgi:hypothetical protein
VRLKFNRQESAPGFSCQMGMFHGSLIVQAAESLRGDLLNQREIPNYWQGHCFGCSQTNTHGLQLRFWLSGEGCFTRCTIPERLCGWDGLVHGGIVAALLDEVAAWTIIARLGRLGITVGCRFAT